ncbi:MAG: PRC-barrel domain-containing protein [Holophagaceae bacterium]|nr:PRC-barrel domain-containing protein [Holophagaceae bacterium]
MFSNSPVKASSVIGTGVVNPQGESLGEIKELVIDPRIGRVAYAVVSLVRSFVMGEKLFAIPFSAFDYNVTKNQYVLDVSRERMIAAPGFDANHWPTMSEETWNREISSYYGRTPFWE